MINALPQAKKGKTQEGLCEARKTILPNKIRPCPTKRQEESSSYEEISDYVMVYCRPGMVTQLPSPICVCPPKGGCYFYWAHIPKLLYYIYIVSTF